MNDLMGAWITRSALPDAIGHYGARIGGHWSRCAVTPPMLRWTLRSGSAMPGTPTGALGVPKSFGYR
jgi:hypothetical protein